MDAPLPPDTVLGSSARLAAVDRAEEHAARSPEPMARIARLAQRYPGAPIGLVNLVRPESQNIIGVCAPSGDPYLDAMPGRLTRTLCQHVVRQAAPLQIIDARASPDFAANDATRQLGVVAYLGVPLWSAEGEVLGTVCAIDREPREWTAEQQSALEDLSAFATLALRYQEGRDVQREVLERWHQEVHHDLLTGLHNRRQWLERAPIELARALREQQALSVVCFDCDGFKAINDDLGHAAGDEMLVRLADRWKAIVRAPDLLIRWGGDEFVVLATNTNHRQAQSLANRLTEAVADIFSVSAGVAEWDREEAIQPLFERADLELIAAKRARRLT